MEGLREGDTLLRGAAQGITPGTAVTVTRSAPRRSPALINYDYDGAKFVDLLIYGPMISDLLTIGILWHAIQSFPGFLETVGYLFGMLAASFTLEAYWQSDVE